MANVKVFDRITGKKTGKGIILDGVDISNAVTDVDIRVGARGVSEVCIVVIPEMVTFEGEANVTAFIGGKKFKQVQP